MWKRQLHIGMHIRNKAEKSLNDSSANRLVLRSDCMAIQINTIHISPNVLYCATNMPHTHTCISVFDCGSPKCTRYLHQVSVSESLRPLYTSVNVCLNYTFGILAQIYFLTIQNDVHLLTKCTRGRQQCTEQKYFWRIVLALSDKIPRYKRFTK